MPGMVGEISPFLASAARRDWPRAVWRRACVLLFIVCSFNVFLVARGGTLLNFADVTKTLAGHDGLKGRRHRSSTGVKARRQMEGWVRRERSAKLASNNTPMWTDEKQDTLLK